MSAFSENGIAGSFSIIIFIEKYYYVFYVEGGKGERIFGHYRKTFAIIYFLINFMKLRKNLSPLPPFFVLPERFRKI
jgi:hypothetical protein